MDFSPPLCQGDILIVDDLADNLRILANTLASQGHRVRAVRSGTMALIGAKAFPPDIILLDIRMPTMDGFEVCRQLKASAVTRHVPIIFLSALDDASDKTRAFEVGGVDYITKPFHDAEVTARVQHQLAIQQLHRQVLTHNQAPSDPPSSPSLSTAIHAAHTILAYSDRLSQSPDRTGAIASSLEDLRLHGQTILRLLNSLGDELTP
ncbi:response regulator [Leptolyngbya sp. KIOST-1]|uniref:response regulator n=1 Tax=Leptolyngbya sp. KIOST-1 TaxID=1229172 RepID=UPI00055CC473|nr:response regulator [Leptolyngbya sp. KIOST-1]